MVTLQGAIDNRLRQARIELAAGALRHQDQRVAMIAVMALVRLVQHAALRVGRTGNDQRAAGGGKTRPHAVQNFTIRVRGEFVGHQQVFGFRELPECGNSIEARAPFGWR